MSHHRSSCLATAPLLLLILSFLVASFFDTAGVCYGRIGNNLSRPADVVAFYGELNIQLMRLYDPNREVLTALKGSNIELLLDVPNSDIQRIASNQSEADTWVSNNVRNYANSVRFHYISVGNEVQPSDPDQTQCFSSTQCKTWRKLFQTSGSTDMRDVNNMRDVSLEYALLTPNTTVVNDGSNIYRNFFVALLDTIYAALEELSGGAVKIVVSESGWPTAGGTAANVYNARTYVKNLIRTVNCGSPKRPERATKTYLLLDFDIKSVNNCSDISGSRLDNRR